MTIKLKKGMKLSEFDNRNVSPFLKKIDAKKFVGIIKLKKDPMGIQSQLRNEWK